MLRVKRCHPSAILPTLATPGSSALDLYCVESQVIGPKCLMRFRTGICVELPPGHFGLLQVRSGWVHQLLTVLGGVIDNDYRGEILVNVFNASSVPVAVATGMRVGQLLCLPYTMPTVVEVNELQPTLRGASGFGSSGK